MRPISFPRDLEDHLFVGKNGVCPCRGDDNIINLRYPASMQLPYIATLIIDQRPLHGKKKFGVWKFGREIVG